MTTGGRADTYWWDHGPSTVLGQPYPAQHHGRSSREDGSSFSRPIPPSYAPSWNRFFPAQGAKRSCWQPGLVSIPPKTHPGPTPALGRGVGGAEPGNLAFPHPTLSQEKGEFRCQTGSAPKSPGIWRWQGRDRQHRAISKQHFFLKKQSKIFARKCYFDRFGNRKSFQSGVLCSEADPNIKEMEKEKSLAQLQPLVRDPAGWDGGEPPGSRVGLGPVLRGGSEAAWKAKRSRDGTATRGVGVQKVAGPDPDPHIIPPLRDHGGCSGGATIPGDKQPPVSLSPGQVVWGTMAFPLQTQTLRFAPPQPRTPNPVGKRAGSGLPS